MAGAARRAPGALPRGATLRTVARWREGARSEVEDALAEEVPVAIAYNGDPFAVMLMSPGDLEDFALGFTLSEGIVERRDEIGAIEVSERIEAIEIDIAIPAPRAALLAARERSIEGRSGCGACGSRRVEAVLREPRTVGPGTSIDAAALQGALAAMSAAQALNAATGATHAAAFADVSGDLLALREDVGRHNALDKLIGALLRARIDAGAGFVVVTSRASWEIVMKAASAGCALLAAVSAPTAMAVHLAERCGMTLIGYARSGGCSVYAHAQRFRGDGR